MKHEQIGQEIGKLVDVKNVDYGSAFSKSHEILEILYPNGISKEQMKDALFITRVLDKLFRIATSKNVLNEDAYADIAGYAILATTRERNEKLDALEQEKFEKIKNAPKDATPLWKKAVIVENDNVAEALDENEDAKS